MHCALLFIMVAAAYGATFQVVVGRPGATPTNVYLPPVASARIGDTVTFTWAMDGTSVTAFPGSGAAFDSGILNNGATWDLEISVANGFSAGAPFWFYSKGPTQCLNGFVGRVDVSAYAGNSCQAQDETSCRNGDGLGPRGQCLWCGGTTATVGYCYEPFWSGTQECPDGDLNDYQCMNNANDGFCFRSGNLAVPVVNHTAASSPQPACPPLVPRTTTVPRTTVPARTTTTVPRTTTTVPSRTTTAIPGRTTTAIPGRTTTAIPGRTTTVPGRTTTVPGRTTTVPGASGTTIPGTAGTTIPGGSTSTAASIFVSLTLLAAALLML